MELQLQLGEQLVQLQVLGAGVQRGQGGCWVLGAAHRPALLPGHAPAPAPQPRPHTHTPPKPGHPAGPGRTREAGRHGAPVDVDIGVDTLLC